MKKDIKFYSRYFASRSIMIILFGTCLVTLARSQDAWTAKADMPTARWALSSTAVNGKIYVMGGAITGSNWGDQSSPIVEVYDPQTDNWDTTKTDIPIRRNSFSSNVINGKIYIFGGQSNVGTINLSTVEEYDPLTDTWATKTPMPDERAGLSSGVVKGKIYVIGGWNYYPNSNNTYSIGKVWEYDPGTDAWDTTRAEMEIPREYLTTSVVDGKIYAFGGWDESVVYKTVEMYDPATDVWTTLNEMPEQRVYLKSGVVNNRIYIFGGSTLWSVPPKSDTWEYNPITDTYKVVTLMPMGIMHASASVVNGKIYTFGGTSLPISFPVQATSKVFEYDPLPTGVKNISEFPEAFILHQNYPNPFNPETTIQYQLPKKSEVKLAIVNLLGQRVATLVNEVQSNGTYSIQWDGKDDTGTELASGIYLFRLQN